MLADMDELQDTARTRFADMLHDDERNLAYRQAIRVTVQFMVQSKEHNPTGNRFFKICDIGAGTGLLSMMVVEAFERINYKKFHVTAFECFKPMANCAKKIIRKNGMSEYITLIPTRSDEYQGNLKADLLVAELLDTELIGEGCLQAYRHAVENICSPKCLFVPQAANIYIEPVASSLLFSRHSISNLKFKLGKGQSVKIKLPEGVEDCIGVPVLDDLQASALIEGRDFIRVSEPQVVFHFEFNSLLHMKEKDHKKVKFTLTKEIQQPIVLVVWWDIVMFDHALLKDYGSSCNDDIIDGKPAILDILTCAPTWARSEQILNRDKLIVKLCGRDVWREHWMQAIYFLLNTAKTKKLVGREVGSQLTIHVHHDLYSLWFDLKAHDVDFPDSCKCGTHLSLHRFQLWMLNNSDIMAKLIKPCVLDCKFPIKGDINFRMRPQDRQEIGLSEAHKWEIRFKDALGEPIDMTLKDPSFYDECSWEKMIARYYLKGGIEPIESFCIKFTQVQFKNLSRIRTKIGKCMGYDMKMFDRLIGEASKIVDPPVDSHHLWEYESKRLDQQDYILYSSKHDPNLKEKETLSHGSYHRNFKLPINAQEKNWQNGWALVFWAEFTMMKTNEIIALGPVEKSNYGEPIVWTKYASQIVHFLHDESITEPSVQNWIDLEISLNIRGNIVVSRNIEVPVIKVLKITEEEPWPTKQVRRYPMPPAD